VQFFQSGYRFCYWRDNILGTFALVHIQVVEVIVRSDWPWHFAVRGLSCQRGKGVEVPFVYGVFWCSAYIRHLCIYLCGPRFWCFFHLLFA
jgi:hypothetical protein